MVPTDINLVQVYPACELLIELPYRYTFFFFNSNSNDKKDTSF